jgi:hypothetical protein
MSRSTAQFITRLKLRELSRQRDRLRDTYARIVREADAETTPRPRLRRLFEGLAEVQAAGRPLHPEVANLEPLLSPSAGDAFPPETATGWAERLERELAHGRLRSEFVYLFGALLDEWGQEGAATGEGEEQRRTREEMTTFLLTPPEPPPSLAVLRATLDELEPALSAQAERAPALVEAGALHGGDLEIILPRVAASPYCATALRAEARAYAGDALARGELRDALNLYQAERAEWDWPAGGVVASARWAQHRWRLYLDEDLPTRCLLETVGEYLGDAFRRMISSYETLANRRERMNKLRAIHAPEDIIEHEARLLREEEAAVLLDASAPDLWAGETEVANEAANSEFGGDFHPEDAEIRHGSILATRREEMEQLRVSSSDDAYSPAGSDRLYRVVPLVNAEVRTARAAFPARPLYVLKADLREFYASVPHAALLLILERFGVPEAERTLVSRFLSPPLVGAGGGTPERARRGVPLNHPLSHLLTDLLLRLMERHVGAGGRVRILRQVDDICLLTPDPDAALTAWQRLAAFCADCGLTLNAEKSGAVCVGGGALPDGLPTAPPRWGLLVLRADGEWEVDEAAFAEYAAVTRDRWDRATAVLEKVRAYNEAARYLLRSLAPDADLGDRHRADVADACRRFHRELFGPGRGAGEALRALVAERFDVPADLIPEAWLYWPLTAGGLGLLNPALTAEQYAPAYQNRQQVPVPAWRGTLWEHGNNGWSHFYRHFLHPVPAFAPKTTPESGAREQDFIARGREISAGAQAGLSSYWRWTLALYGPEILDRFGTYRFLITELVPLALIRQQRGLESLSLSEGGEDDFTASRPTDDAPDYLDFEDPFAYD